MQSRQEINNMDQGFWFFCVLRWSTIGYDGSHSVTELKIKLEVGIKSEGRKEDNHSKCSLFRSVRYFIGVVKCLLSKLNSWYDWDIFELYALIKSEFQEPTAIMGL